MFGPMTVVTSSVLIMPDQHCFLRSRFSSQSYNGAGENFTETVVGVNRMMTVGRHVSVSCLSNCCHDLFPSCFFTRNDSAE